MPAGSGNQLASLSWNGIDQLIITFSEDIQVVQNDLVLASQSAEPYIFSDFTYDTVLRTSTWMLAKTIPADSMTINLSDTI